MTGLVGMASVSTAIGVAKKFWPLLVVLAIGLVFLLTYCMGQKSGEQRYENQRLEANQKVQQQKAAADTGAADQRVTDTSRIQQQREELRDARTTAPSPSDRRRHGCVILRQQGKDTSRIPACRGLAPGT